MSERWDLDNGVGGGPGYGNDPWPNPPGHRARPADPFAVGDPRDDAADITVGGVPPVGGRGGVPPGSGPALGGPAGGFPTAGPAGGFPAAGPTGSFPAAGPTGGFPAAGAGHGDGFTVGDEPGPSATAYPGVPAPGAGAFDPFGPTAHQPFAQPAAASPTSAWPAAGQGSAAYPAGYGHGAGYGYGSGAGYGHGADYGGSAGYGSGADYSSAGYGGGHEHGAEDENSAGYAGGPGYEHTAVPASASAADVDAPPTAYGSGGYGSPFDAAGATGYQQAAGAAGYQQATGATDHQHAAGAAGYQPAADVSGRQAAFGGYPGTGYQSAASAGTGYDPAGYQAAGYPSPGPAAPGAPGQAGDLGAAAPGPGATGRQDPFLVDPYPRTGDHQFRGYFAAAGPAEAAPSTGSPSAVPPGGRPAHADPHPSFPGELGPRGDAGAHHQLGDYADPHPSFPGPAGPRGDVGLAHQPGEYADGYPAAGYATNAGPPSRGEPPAAAWFPGPAGGAGPSGPVGVERPAGLVGPSGPVGPAGATGPSAGGAGDLPGPSGAAGLAAGGFAATQAGGYPPGGYGGQDDGYGDPTARPRPAPAAPPPTAPPPTAPPPPAPPPPPGEGGSPAGRPGRGAGRAAPPGMERRTEALRFRINPPDDDLYGAGNAAGDQGGQWVAGARAARDGLPDDDFDDASLDDDVDDYLDDDDPGRRGPGRHDELDDDLDQDSDLADAHDRRRGAYAPARMSRGRDGGGRGRGGALPKLLAMLVVVAVVLGGLIFVGGKLVGKIGGPPEIPDYPGPGTGSATVTIAQGASATQIAKVLFDAGVVKSQKAFRTAAANNPDSVKIQPGTYTLRKQMSAAGALEALLDPTANKYRLTIPEGRTVDWILTEVSRILGVPKDQYEAIAKDPAGHGLKLPAYWKDPGPSAKNKLEGFLFPTTYNLNPKATPVETLQSMVDQFTSTASAINLEGKAAALGRTPAELITVASIIEMEVNGHDEGPKVARVIYNRLANKNGEFNSLGMDSTTRYAFDRPTGSIRDLINRYHPYNTRSSQVRGLPPGAIANPGRWALESALNPYQGTDGTWYFFVYLPHTQRTEFATTDAEWTRLLARYQAEGGSSGG